MYSDLFTGMKILIVDDIVENIKVLGTFLRNSGFSVLPATSGRQAIELAAAKNPDLILLDVQMPEMDGYAVCIELKKNELTKNIPVIFLTAKTEISDIERGFEVGGLDYITKPFNYAELKIRVFNQLEIKKSREVILQHKKDLVEAFMKLKNEQDKTIELEKTKSVLAMVVTTNHELNQPLSVLKGYCDILRKSLNEKLDEKQQQQFQKMSTAINTMADILKKFSHFKSFDYKDYLDGVKMVVFTEEDKLDSNN